ncbi:hypothetical protein CTAYLR_008872 [Chrysophaeum taylorii]|uniref:C2 domain-containing protein n=1 Tax=Chrysophaeum taylorii TaxID=2483200 RepID=A0AAD7XK38_9STRA|nr:hypothetical protein CTAYLR_008872 [Chrysophaeum taylorii]
MSFGQTFYNPLRPEKSSSSSSAPASSEDGFAPFVNDQDLDPEKEPNELRIGLARGRNLAVADSTPFGGGSSDPRMRFVVQGTQMKKEPSVKSDHKTDTLNPVWNQVLSVKLKKSKVDGASPVITGYCEDWDMTSDSDPMGQFVVPLDRAFADHKVVAMKWYPLKKSKDMMSTASGEIQCSFQWWYNPSLDIYDPFKKERTAFVDPMKIPRPPNELRVGIFRAKGIVGDDDSGGTKTSDPRCKLTIRGPAPAATMEKPPRGTHPKVDQGAEKDAAEDDDDVEKDDDAKDDDAAEEKGEDEDAAAEDLSQDEAVPFDQPKYTDKCSATLRPVWKTDPVITFEHVKAPVKGAESAADFPRLEIVVEDVDLTSSPTFLGKVLIPLGPLANQKVSKMKWYPLVDDPELNAKKYKITGSIELTIHWWYNIELDPHGDEPRKNETLLSYLTPDFLEDAIESVVKSGEEMFYDIANTMLLIADLYAISQEWKICVDAISVVVGLTPTVNDAISEAQDIASIFIKILSAATGNPAAILYLLYSGYKVLNNSKSLFHLYDESGRFVESMLAIEHFVIIVMDVIRRGYVFYKAHFAKMEKKERADARSLAKKGGQQFEFEPEWSTREDLYEDEKPNTLYVGVSRARDVAIKDHYIIMSGGTSDPRTTLEVRTPIVTQKKQTSTKFGTLKPQWNEDFKFEGVVPPDETEILSKIFFGDDDEEDEDETDPTKQKTTKDPDQVKAETEIPDVRPVKPPAYDDGREDDDDDDSQNRRGKPLVRKVPEDIQAKQQSKLWRIVANLEDVDLASSSDSLGSVVLDMLPLRNHKLMRKWHLLKKKPKWAIEEEEEKNEDEGQEESKGDEDDDDKKDGDDKKEEKKKKPAAKVKSYSMFDDDGDDDGNISGEVELLVRWLYEPDADPWQPPFASIPLPEDPPALFNEIRVGVFRGRDLPAMDDNVLTEDSSDPMLTFVVEPNFPVEGAAKKKPMVYKSSTQHQTLHPVWREVVNIRGGPWGKDSENKIDDYTLKVSCLDYDLTSASDPMGSFEIPLADLLDGKVLRKWFSLPLPENVKPVNAEALEKAGTYPPKSEIELFLQLAFNPNPPDDKKSRRLLSKSAFPGLCGSCACGAPPAPEAFDGAGGVVEDDDRGAVDVPASSEFDPAAIVAEPVSAEQICRAKENAIALGNSLGKNERLLEQLVRTYRDFLGNPENKRKCLALADALRDALDSNRMAAAGRSLYTSRANNGRFPLAVSLRLPPGFATTVAGRRRLGASTRLGSKAWRKGYLATKWTSRAPLGGPSSAEGGDGKMQQEDVKPSVEKTTKASAKGASQFMSSLESGLMNMVQDIINVTELYNDLTRMNANWNDALKALAFVENCIPKIVSALEVIQSIVQVILKAIQGISFPPNPAVLVDLLHTARSIFKQAKSVYEVYKCNAQLGKAVGVLTLFGKYLVDSISRAASLLSGEDGGICRCC